MVGRCRTPQDVWSAIAGAHGTSGKSMSDPTTRLASTGHRRRPPVRFGDPFASDSEYCHSYENCPSAAIRHAHLLMKSRRKSRQ